MPFLPPYRIFDRNGLKVAVVGIMDVEMRKYILDENFAIPAGELQLADPAAVLNDSCLEFALDFHGFTSFC